MRQKGVAPILILLVVVGLGLLAYFSFFYKSPSPSPVQETTSPVPTATSSTTAEPTTKPTTDPTANWKNYENNLFEFSFKHPNEYLLNDNLQKSTDPQSWTTNSSIKLNNSTNNCSISIMINPDGFGPHFPNKWLKVGYTSAKGIGIISETAGTENIDENLYSLIISGSLTSKNVVGIWISTSCPDTPANRTYLDTTIRQILSTFKFTN